MGWRASISEERGDRERCRAAGVAAHSTTARYLEQSKGKGPAPKGAEKGKGFLDKGMGGASSALALLSN